MSRKQKGKGLFAGLKGWEVTYLKRAEKFGHLSPKKKSNRRGNRND
ncbi:MAG: hypothetical protein GXO26_00695 [Crenarchaeota archaeon]|nr:hypothetical protein [Thermoproteota archaeon]